MSYFIPAFQQCMRLPRVFQIRPNSCLWFHPPRTRLIISFLRTCTPTQINRPSRCPSIRPPPHPSVHPHDCLSISFVYSCPVSINYFLSLECTPGQKSLASTIYGLVPAIYQNLNHSVPESLSSPLASHTPDPLPFCHVLNLQIFAKKAHKSNLSCFSVTIPFCPVLEKFKAILSNFNQS